jgi:ABC-type lipoprotein release transport system permease subunit
MILLRLALKNLFGAGIRTWLNAAVISLALVAVVWNQSLLTGFDEQASQAMIDAEYGGGQYWQESYDPFDPLSIDDAHAEIPDAVQELMAKGEATPILIVQGVLYVGGRMKTVLIKGIDPEQKILSIPSFVLKEGEELPVLIGTRMAKSAGLQEGDSITLRWREAGGAFNALDARVVKVMSTIVQSIDSGQVWVPLKTLQSMTCLEGQATIAVLGKGTSPPGEIEGWNFRDREYLLRDIKGIIKSKNVGRTVFFVILLSLGMLAIFDTQVLNIFRRRKEMGTLMALGFTRGKIIGLFTLEGALHGVLAILIGAVYGLPLLYYMAVKGFSVPGGMEDFGFALGEKIFPAYSAGLLLGTTLLVLAVTTLVSFLPTRKIARLKPTDALRGKLT